MQIFRLYDRRLPEKLLPCVFRCDPLFLYLLELFLSQWLGFLFLRSLLRRWLWCRRLLSALGDAGDVAGEITCRSAPSHRGRSDGAY